MLPKLHVVNPFSAMSVKRITKKLIFFNNNKCENSFPNFLGTVNFGIRLFSYKKMNEILKLE